MSDISPPPFDQRPRRRAKWPLVVFLAALGVLAMAAGALIFVVTDGTSPTIAQSSTTTAGSTTAPSTSAAAAVTTPRTPTTPQAPTTPPQPTFAQQETFARNLYGLLPGNTEQAFALFGQRYVAKTGKADFLQFWSTIDSVSVLAVVPSGPSTVVATIRYVTRNGRVDTERRSLTTVAVDGKLRLDDSARLGPA
ncbi:MAG: hypothetical protein WBF79_15980 [Rhodococcus sp. (in: high G+C Gram-positive bacteria)]